MQQTRTQLNFREHIQPLVIADTILLIGLVMLILVWVFGDEPNAFGGFISEYKQLLIGLGAALTLGGGVMLAIAVHKLIRAAEQK